MTPTEFYKHLADDIRLKSMLLIVEEEELCVCELMVALGEMSQPKVSRHLALLKTAGLLLTRKQKQWVFYRINSKLPKWTLQVLKQTLAENSMFLAKHRQALHAMGERPARLESCC